MQINNISFGSFFGKNNKTEIPDADTLDSVQNFYDKLRAKNGAKVLKPFHSPAMAKLRAQLDKDTVEISSKNN